MATESDIDRLSALPDNILACNIFSLLSLRDVLRTSVLSSRWQFLWKQIPHLDFSRDFFESLKLSLGIGSRWDWNENPDQKVKCLNGIIDSILLLHSEHIERFSIHVSIRSSESEVLEGLPIEQWVHHAAVKEVKHMSLGIFTEYSSFSEENLDIPLSLFSCHLLRNLELHKFRFTGIPIEFDGFPFLESCCLSHLDDFTDDGLKQLIGLCPLLRKLVLLRCSQLINVKVQASNLNSLIIGRCYAMESLTADCPQLVELGLYNCDRLIDFKMNSCVFFHDLHSSDAQIPKELPMLNSLKRLLVKACRRVSDLALLTTLGYLRNLETVQIQMCEADHSQKEWTEGDLVADSTFPSLKKAYADISSTIRKEEAIMLAFLLRNAPSLTTITVTLPYCPGNIHDKEFRNKVLDLQQIYEKVDIRMKVDEKRLDAICDYDDDTYVDLNYGSDVSL